MAWHPQVAPNHSIQSPDRAGIQEQEGHLLPFARGPPPAFSMILDNKEPLCSFQLPLARPAHHIKWKQKKLQWNEGNVQAFSSFCYPTPPLSFLVPYNLNPSWRAATTPGWGAGHQDHSSVEMTSLPGTGFQLAIPQVSKQELMQVRHKNDFLCRTSGKSVSS